MKLLALALIFAASCFAVPCDGGAGCVQAAANQSAGSGTTFTVTFASNVTAGNLIMVQANCDGLRTATMADSLGSTYTQISDTPHSSVTFEMWTFWAKAASSGADTITVTWNSACDFRVLLAVELSGLNTVSPVDGTPAGASGDGASVDTGNTTTSNASDLLICSLATWSSTGTFSEEGGFVQMIFTGSADGGELQSKSVSATGTYNCTSTLSSGSNFKWIAAVFGLKTAATTQIRHRIIQ